MEYMNKQLKKLVILALGLSLVSTVEAQTGGNYTFGRNIKTMKLRTGRGMADTKAISNSQTIQKADMQSSIKEVKPMRPFSFNAHEIESASSMESATDKAPQGGVDNSLLFTAQGFGMDKDKSYEKADNKVIKLEVPNTLTIDAASNKIASAAGAKTTKQKARAIFTWIANNIAYDSTAKNKSVEEVFETRTATSDGFAALYKKMADILGLNCYFVVGDLKPWGYTKGTESTYHAWNIVTEGNNTLIMLDPTLAAGHIDENKAFVAEFNDEWFDVDPYLMLFSHLPKCGQFQYVGTYLTPAQFLDIPRIEPRIKWAGIDERNIQSYLYGHKKSWCPLIVNDSKAFENGVKISKLQMAENLKIGKGYKFNFTIPENSTVWAKLDGKNYELKNGEDVTLTPESEGKLTFFYAHKGAATGEVFLSYNVTKEGSVETYTRVNTFPKKSSYTPEEADMMCLSNVNSQKQLVIYPGRKKIQPDEFRNRNDFESVNIPNTIKEIGYRAFENCAGLKTLNVPNTTEEIDDRAFLDCFNLSSATIGAKEIGDEAFWECNKMTKLIFTSNVKEIGESAFAYCTKLTDVSLGESTKKVGKWAFWTGGGQLRLYLPESVSEAEDYVINPADKLIVPATSYARQYAQKQGLMFLIEE